MTEPETHVTELRPLSAVDPSEIEALLDAAFGTDRHERTAYKVRAGLAPIADLSFTAFRDGKLAGSLQSWPVALAGADGSNDTLVMVGPVAVRPDLQGQGVGKLMTRTVAERLDEAGLSAMMIGDPEYYAPYGFLSGPAGQWAMPGPVAPHRILLRPAAGASWPRGGTLGPAPFALRKESA